MTDRQQHTGSLQAIAARMGALVLLTIGLVSATGGEGRAAELLLKKESVYNTIFVFQDDTYRYLKFGHNARHYTESVYNPEDPTELPARYTQYLTAGLAYAPKLEKAAMIGMGGGRTTWYLSHHVPELTVTGVELDPAIVDIADEHFDVREGENLKIAEMDGRLFVRRSRETFDLIFVDAYRGPFVPFHLLTKEFYELLEKRLTPGGAVVQNIEPSTMLFDHALATIGSVFDTIDLYRAGGNSVAIAYDGPRRSLEELQARGKELSDQYGLRYRLDTMAGERVRKTPEFGRDKVLTDDFAPANYLKSVEKHNRKWDE